MSRVHAIPFRIRVVFRRAPNGAAIQDQWHSFKTMAGLVEYRERMLRRPNVYKIESFMMIDETMPGIPQVETEMRTQASRNGVDRHVVSHQNGRRGAST